VVDYISKDYDWNLCEGLSTCTLGSRNLYAKFYTKYGIPSPAYSVTVLWKDQTVVTPVTEPEVIVTPVVVTSTTPVGTSTIEVAPVTETGGFKVCAPASFDEALRVGALGGNVEKLQYVLKQQGFFKGNITGIFGVTTEAAVINFQKAKGIKPASGRVEAKTVKALTALKICQVFEPVIKPKMETKCAKFDKYLYQGISGDQVKRVQDILRYFGYYTDKVTGYYGPVTRKAVSDFQSDAGLLEKMKNPKLDKGRVGPETRKFLNDLFPCE